MQNRAFGGCSASIWGQVGWYDIRALRSVRLCTVAWENPACRDRFCMLSIKVLMGLISVIAHHFMEIISRSARSDCSLALRPGTADTMRAWLHPCSRASQLSLFLLSLSSSTPPYRCFWGFIVKGCQNPFCSNKREREKDVLSQPSSVIPSLLYWHSRRVASGQKWGHTGEEMRFPAGRKGDTPGAGEQHIALMALSWKTVPAPEG